jgi:hypothetical protein
LREGQRWEPHVLPLRIQSITNWERWEVKKGVISSIYRQMLQSESVYWRNQSHFWDKH